jgi:hypothetical protein
MPLQNRVTPWGALVAVPERGLFMGNRGCLHDQQRHVIRAWARLPWVTCRLDFKGRRRELMAPGNYTELFFLDEATALAAGHRPCATCRREAYGTFKELWTAANPQLAGRTDGSINAIDRQLHAERVDANGRKRTWSAVLGGLPDGVVVALAQDAEPLLVRRGYLHPWLPGGYGSPVNADPQTRVLVLTPLSLTRMLAHGYVPQLHPSIEGGRLRMAANELD